jgi:hypothetical protein
MAAGGGVADHTEEESMTRYQLVSRVYRYKGVCSGLNDVAYPCPDGCKHLGIEHHTTADVGVDSKEFTLSQSPE